MSGVMPLYFKHERSGIMCKASCFPDVKIQTLTLKKTRSDDFKTRYKALRNLLSSFLKKQNVRDMIFDKCGGKCYICGTTTDNLQIDHVVSVYRYAKLKLPYIELNAYENLMLICRRCNSSKLP